MITDKITVYGEKQEAEVICDLLEKCITSSESDVDFVDVYLWKTPHKAQELSCERLLVLPYEMREGFPKLGRSVTYSDSDSSADVCAVNPQQRKDSACFELLSGAFMSRVFIPDESKYTQRQVLVCASVLYALGNPIKNVVSLINESLK